MNGHPRAVVQVDPPQPLEDTVPDDALAAEQITDPATGMTRADLRRAALTVCSYAQDPDEARDLLDALGLLDDLKGDHTLAS